MRKTLLSGEHSAWRFSLFFEGFGGRTIALLISLNSFTTRNFSRKQILGEKLVHPSMWFCPPEFVPSLASTCGLMDKRKVGIRGVTVDVLNFSATWSTLDRENQYPFLAFQRTGGNRDADFLTMGFLVYPRTPFGWPKHSANNKFTMRNQQERKLRKALSSCQGRHCIFSRSIHFAVYTHKWLELWNATSWLTAWK